MKKVTIIDYGMSNLLSISRAVEKVGAEVELSGDANTVASADILVLPGVGAFYDGMNELNKRNLPEAIHQFLKTGKPFLGICLGMQMMLQEGTEVRLTPGLNVIPGCVLPLPEKNKQNVYNTIPHIGWSNLIFKSEVLNTPFRNTTPKTMMYFVHSYYASPTEKHYDIAYSPFRDREYCSVVNKDNAWGTQFHPEKSGEAGLGILKLFVNS
jgi:glutamine amidotransferase